MAKLLLLVVSSIALIGMAVGFQQKQLRCSDTNSYGSGLTNYRMMCLEHIPSSNPDAPTTDLWKEKMKDPARMLDFVEHCTCILLSMSMAWETMLTHEVEILFAVSRDFVDEFHRQVESLDTKSTKMQPKKLPDLDSDSESSEPFELLPRRSNPLFSGDDGDSLYHYYVLNYIVSTANTPNDKEKFFKRIMRRTAQIYFSLKHLESSYIKDKTFPMEHPFTLIMSGACKDLFNSFGPYLESISMMKYGFKNDMWTYRVVSHDETLFKLVISSMLCRVVNDLVESRQRAIEEAKG